MIQMIYRSDGYENDDLQEMRQGENAGGVCQEQTMPRRLL